MGSFQKPCSTLKIEIIDALNGEEGESKVFSGSSFLSL